MKLLGQMRSALRRTYHQREIEASLRDYQARTGRMADTRAAYADSGTFREQVDRLFSVGSASETPLLQEIAQSAVRSCVTNKYYRPADCLADVVDALTTWTFVTGEPNGEPPLEGLEDYERRAKLSTVMGAWLVPLKIGALEEVLTHYAQRVGRALPYAALARFERQAARLFGLIDQGEVVWVTQRMQAFIDDWQGEGASRQRFREPVDGLAHVVACLEGDAWLDAMSPLRVRARHLPLRLSTVVSEERGQYLDAVFSSLAAPQAADARQAGPAAAAAEASAVAGAAAGAGAVAGSAPTSASHAPPPVPLAADTGQKEEPQGPSPLTIVLSCPKCGAPCTIDDETVSLECSYCSSLLIFSAPGRDEIYLQGSLIQSDEQVLHTIVAYRANEQRAAIADLHRDSEGNPPPEWFIMEKVRAFEQKLLTRARLLETRWLYGPYWHITGKILQGVLGRTHIGSKELHVRAFTVEHTVPAYDVYSCDLRDRGLRLRRSKVEPLTVRRVQETGPFLPWVSIRERSYHEVNKWCTRDLQKDLDPIGKHGEFLFGRRVLVYRPYCVAQVEVDRGAEWVLVDGGFGTIAGYPTADEGRALLEGCVRDPLRSEQESYRKVVTVPSRCPDCGHEQRLDRRLYVAICPNCHRGLMPVTTGIEVFSYDHAETGAAASTTEYLPFWRYDFKVDLPEGASLSDLETYARSLFHARDLPRLPISGNGLWVPALRLLGTEMGDQAFAALCQWLHRAPPTLQQGRVPLGEEPVFWGASLPESEARELGRYVLMALHDKTSAARLNGLLVKKRMAEPGVSVTAPRLVMVPLAGRDRGLEIPGSRGFIPRLLLTGGPQLEALRASVHRQWARPV